MGGQEPDGPVTILFTDVEGSTALHAAQGDAAAQSILQACEELVRRELPTYGGRAIKSLGDGLMVAFASPRKAVACALAIQSVMADHGLRHPEPLVRLRIGLHTGEATQVGDDLVGTAVNAAARICAKARGGEVLTSDVVRQLCGATTEVSFSERGRLALKGFPERWRLFRVVPAMATPTAPMPITGLTLFVGREAERNELRALLVDLEKGRGGLVMIAGEPGVGKTRLTQEIAAEARQRGFRAFTGHCYEGEGLPYMPWVEIVESAVRESAPEVLRPALGEAAPELARIVPQLKRMFPDIPPPLDLPPEQQRRHMYNSIRDYLSRVARIRPQFLVLEDLHWADESTLLFLEHLADVLHTIPALVIATYRDPALDVSPRLAETLSMLIRRRQVHMIDLERHSEAEVASLLQALSGHEPPPAVAAAIYGETDGNAFFVEEVFRHLSKSGRLLDSGGDFREDLRIEEFDVPANVLLVTGQRLDRLTETTRRMLTVGAVIGRHFSFELLQAAAEVEADELLDAIDEGEGAQAIVAGSAGPDAHLWFTHELIRQTLLARLSPPRRQRYHLRVADALERVHVGDVELHASDVAHHLTQAGAAADPARTARYLVLAGDRAQAAAAFGEALRHYAQALNIVPEKDTRSRADLLVKVGLAQRSLSRWDEAAATWHEALGALEALGDVEALAGLCWELCIHLAWAYELPTMLEVAQRGLNASGTAPSRHRTRMLGIFGLALSLQGDFRGAALHIDEARKLAEGHGDARLLGDIWLLQMLHDFYHMRLPEVLEASRHAAAKLREAAALWNLAEALAFMDVAYVFQGRFSESDEVHRELEPLADRLGQWAAAGVARRNSFASSAARVADLELLATLEAPSRAGPRRRGRRVPRPHGILQFWRGDWSEARAQMEDGVRLARPGFWYGLDHGFLFMLLAYSGEQDRAYALLDEVRDALPKPGTANTLGAWTLAILAAEGAGVLDDAGVARMLYPLVVEALATGTVMRQYDGRLVETAAGMAAAAAGLWDRAEEHFETSLRQAGELPHRLEGPHIRHFYGRFLIRRAGGGDLDRARALLQEAVGGYRDLGMPRHEAMARESLARRV